MKSLQPLIWCFIIILIKVTIADEDIDDHSSDEDDTEYDCNDECHADEVFVPLRMNTNGCNQEYHPEDILNLTEEDACIYHEVITDVLDESGEHEDICLRRSNRPGVEFCGGCKSENDGNVRMLKTPYTLDCETTESNVADYYDAMSDEDEDEFGCDDYPDPKCVVLMK